MLHIISASPYQHAALAECFAVAQKGDALLLLADAVYATVGGAEQFAQFQVYAVIEHIAARGLGQLGWVNYLDYDGMVTLTENHHPVQTWAA